MTDLSAQFNFLDGGERAPGNVAYYVPAGLVVVGSSTVFSITEYAGKSFFVVQNYGASTVNWASPGYSAATGFWTIRHAFDGWGCTIRIINAEDAVLAYLAYNSNGSISLYSNGILLGTSPAGLFFLNTVFQISFSLKANATTGSFVLYLNGNPTAVPGVSVTGVNTSGGQSDLNSVGIQLNILGGTYLYFRDLSCHDGTGPAPLNACLPNCGAELTPPNANISTALVASNSDPNYEIYASAPPGSAFCGSSTVGASDTLAITPLSTNVLAVIGYKTFEYSAKSDTGARATQRSVVSSGATGAGAINYLNDTPLLTEDVYTVDVATSAPITVAAYNALNLVEAIQA